LLAIIFSPISTPVLEVETFLLAKMVSTKGYKVVATDDYEEIDGGFTMPGGPRFLKLDWRGVFLLIFVFVASNISTCFLTLSHYRRPLSPVKASTFAVSDAGKSYLPTMMVIC
jgi:hypothetical protein